MRTLLAASLGAMMIAGPLAAHAATTHPTVDPVPNVVTTTATPYTEGRQGSQAMPAFTYGNQVNVLADAGAATDPAADPAPGASATMTADPLGSGGSQAMPTFISRNAVPVAASPVPGSANSIAAQNGPTSLLHRPSGR